MKDMKHLLFPQSNTGRLRGAVPIPPPPPPPSLKKKNRWKGMFGTNIFHSKAASLPPAPLHQVELLSRFSQLYSQLTHSTWAISKMDCPASTIRHRIRLWEGNKVESSPLLPSNSSSLSQFNTCDIPPKQRGCARRFPKRMWDVLWWRFWSPMRAQ